VLASSKKSASALRIAKPFVLAYSQTRESGLAIDRLDSNESSLETGPKDWIRAFAKGSRRSTASKGDALAHARGVFVYGTEIVSFKFRVVFEDLLLGHTRSEPVEDVPNGNTKSSNAGLPGSLPRFNRDT
jgi:hypothetical protein